MLKNIVFDFNGVILNSQTAELEQAVLDTVISLKEKGYHIHIFTNTRLEYLYSIDEKDDFLNLFDTVISSADFPKPNVEAFKSLVESLGSNPNEIVMIDDKEENISVAKEFGIIGIVFTNIRELKIKLSKLLNDN